MFRKVTALPLILALVSFVAFFSYDAGKEVSQPTQDQITAVMLKLERDIAIREAQAQPTIAKRVAAMTSLPTANLEVYKANQARMKANTGPRAIAGPSMSFDDF